MAEISSRLRDALSKWSSSKWFPLSLAIIGFLIPLLEPLYLLAIGKNIASALWPHALSSLTWTNFLRDYSMIIFILMILVTCIVISLRKRQLSIWIKYCSILSCGIIFSLIFVFMLLDIAYLGGAFLLLPTMYGALLANLLILADGAPKLPKRGDLISSKINRILHLCGVLLATWLVIPGITAYAGLSPSPPSIPEGTYGSDPGPYDYETTIHPYVMPEEVQEIRGDIEGDIEFSVYLTLPVSQNTNFSKLPLAILLHGFASPGFETYEDWVAHLAAKGMAVAYIQYPSDVWPEGAYDYELKEQYGMSNHPFHLPREVAINSALLTVESLIEQNDLDPSHLLIGGHSLGAGYALLVLDKALKQGWGNETLFVDLEAPYARPVQDHLQIDTLLIPEHMVAHITVSEDDRSVSDCFGVYHQDLLKHSNASEILFLEAPSDRHGFPRMVSTHYLQATETHDTISDWAFYRRVDAQADWIVSRSIEDIDAEDNAYAHLTETAKLSYMGEWSDGTAVKQIGVWDDALNHSDFDYCKDWIGPD